MSSKKRSLLAVFLVLFSAAVFFGGLLVLVMHFAGPAPRIAFGQKIGVVTLSGPIMDSREVLADLDGFNRDRSIKAIILRVDSPGGSVGPSQEIYREVNRISKNKPVVASFGSVAASGGYYASAGATRIVANPGTITGSIGVIMEFFRFKSLLEKIGVELEVLKTGEFKDIGSPHRDLTERDREIIGHLIGDIQEQFVTDVAAGRGLELEKVLEIADGRVFSGAKAKELGLVDELGNFQDAVILSKELAGISGEAELVLPKRREIDFLKLLTESAVQTVIRSLEGSSSRIHYRWQGLPEAGFTQTD